MIERNTTFEVEALCLLQHLTEVQDNKLHLPELSELTLRPEDEWGGSLFGVDLSSLIRACTQKRKGKLRQLTLPILPRDEFISQFRESAGNVKVR